MNNYNNLKKWFDKKCYKTKGTPRQIYQKLGKITLTQLVKYGPQQNIFV